uniref:Pre-mRNA-splicing factor CWC24 n=1 Tax=Ganoderma boninense TaxID=34458 RepID=A0A5K1JTJ2_9APHY|nr:DNA repair protein rad18 [Ganoderma boninense]
MADTENVAVPFFKKKGRGRPTTSRKRSVSPPATATAAPVASSSKSQVVLPSRKAAGNLLSAGTKRTVSQRQDDDDQEDTREGPDVKWTAAGSHVNAALEILQGDEAEELLAKRRRSEKKDEEEEEVPDDGLYRGQKAYKSHIRKNQEVPKAMRVGPQRSNNSTIRTVTIVDYQPDVCKDYKETGYCGYGDTCKFLHDRGTYLQGWQLDKLAADPKKQAGEDASDTDSDDEDIPFACLICRKPYTDPVVTRCEHYFCSACAIKRFAKTPKCAACSAPTGGIFNRADKVIAKLKKKQEAADEDGAGEDRDGEGAPAGVRIEGLGQASGSEDE